MKSLVLVISLIFFPFTVAAELLPQGVFPEQPVPITPGYGRDGAGNHSGVPYGVPSAECIVNPVSFTKYYKEVTTTRMEAGDVISVSTTVLFDFNGAVVLPVGVTDLESVVNGLLAAGVNDLQIVGHTDSIGSEERNYDLGLRRAAAVGLVLVVSGFTENISVASGGELEPKVSNTHPDGSDNPEGRQTNRRVDIVVKGVSDVEVSETTIVVTDRNPQIFHVLSSNNSVSCGADRQDRSAYWWSKIW